jgi:peptidoglycan/LPS O-acetylase OafA/YrhL
MGKGVLSRGWYAILTGLVMLFVAYLLAPVGHDDPAAPLVAIAFALLGAWTLWRGVREELRRHAVRRPPSSQP